MSWIDALKATLSVPPGYSYEPHGNRYRDVTNGQWVPFRAIYNVLNANQDHSAEVLSNLCVALKSGEIDLQTWFVTMEAQLRILHVQNAALGAGGFSSLQPIDFMRIDSVLRDEVNRLEKFGNAIVNSGITQGQIDVRCAMYAGTARKEFYKARKLPALDYGQVAIERRVMGVAEHCSWCTYLNDLGWQMAGILPVPGESSATWDGDQCLSNCKCDLERKIVTFAQAEEMIRTPVSSVKAWDESAHPRYPDGTPVGEDGTGGGRFAPKEGASGESDEILSKLTSDSVLVGEIRKSLKKKNIEPTLVNVARLIMDGDVEMPVDAMGAAREIVDAFGNGESWVAYRDKMGMFIYTSPPSISKVLLASAIEGSALEDMMLLRRDVAMIAPEMLDSYSLSLTKRFAESTSPVHPILFGDALEEKLLHESVADLDFYKKFKPEIIEYAKHAGGLAGGMETLVGSKAIEVLDENDFLEIFDAHKDSLNIYDFAPFNEKLRYPASIDKLIQPYRHSYLREIVAEMPSIDVAVVDGRIDAILKRYPDDVGVVVHQFTKDTKWNDLVIASRSIQSMSDSIDGDLLIEMMGDSVPYTFTTDISAFNEDAQKIAMAHAQKLAKKDLRSYLAMQGEEKASKDLGKILKAQKIVDFEEISPILREYAAADKGLSDSNLTTLLSAIDTSTIPPRDALELVLRSANDKVKSLLSPVLDKLTTPDIITTYTSGGQSNLLASSIFNDFGLVTINDVINQKAPSSSWKDVVAGIQGIDSSRMNEREVRNRTESVIRRFLVFHEGTAERLAQLSSADVSLESLGSWAQVAILRGKPKTWTEVSAMLPGRMGGNRLNEIPADIFGTIAKSVPLETMTDDEVFRTARLIEQSQATLTPVFADRLAIIRQYTASFTNGEMMGEPLGSEKIKFLIGDPLEKKGVVEKQKDEIARTLSDLTGYGYSETNDFVKQWADSSNDSDLKSLGVQEVAAEVFGTQLTGWQKEQLDAVKRDRSSPNGKNMYLFEFGMDEESEKEAKGKIGNILQTMYSHTQDWFREHGITHVKLYRGTSLKEAAATPSDTIVRFNDNVLSSWTIDLATTEMFHDGITLSAVIPVEKILSTCKTGFGCWGEYEFVVIGSDSDAYAKVEATEKKSAKSPF